MPLLIRSSVFNIFFLLQLPPSAEGLFLQRHLRRINTLPFGRLLFFLSQTIPLPFACPLQSSDKPRCHNKVARFTPRTFSIRNNVLHAIPSLNSYLRPFVRLSMVHTDPSFNIRIPMRDASTIFFNGGYLAPLSGFL